MFKIAPLAEIAAGTGFTTEELIDFSVGATDGRVYVLFGRDRSETAREYLFSYAVVELEVDWKTGRYLGRRIYHLGDDYRTEYCWLSALGDDFLLVWCRCRYNDGDPERNGLLVGRDGQVRRAYCFGDGITDCLVLPDRTIVTNYDWEGVYGNYGWGAEDWRSEPIGRTGIIAWWPDDRDKRWEGNEPGCWCDAVSRDAAGRLWYFQDGILTVSDGDGHRRETFELSRLSEIRNSEHFAVAASQQKLLFREGYDYPEVSFFLLARVGETWKIEAETIPQLNGVPAGLHPYVRSENLSDHRTLWLTDSEMLCGYRFV
ncbi:hypothetical protein [uncultured Rikenella sp.]|uniref:hypothetical protein n=1 Tax=uncultured Rikenella sp. TaxID=368003 RepID=UPI002610E5C0|nr:hypothetical protein [uncultured Rikenella sp.]